MVLYIPNTFVSPHYVYVIVSYQNGTMASENSEH